jgi:hypothetical protein
MMLSDHILKFYRELTFVGNVPKSVGVMNPYQEPAAFDLCKKFYSKFYHDTNPRTLLLGINPGRFGGGITGIPFTDPIRLASGCGIENTLAKKAELSSEFIYKMIQQFGGAEKFYSGFLISAVCPLGFVKDGKNLNYYDIRELQQAAEPFILQSLQGHLTFGVNRAVCFCLGEGKNFEYLTRLNVQHRFFKKVVPLSHPRFIMQYRRKHVDAHIDDYLKKFRAAKP